MGDTVRMRATVSWEYDADPAHYATSDPEEMRQIDEVGVGDDPALFMNSLDPTTVAVEIVKPERP